MRKPKKIPKERRELIAKALLMSGTVDAEMLKLAMGRYPDDEPQDAYRMFCYDRARAGLGALAKRPRKAEYHPCRGIEQHRRKGLDSEGRVTYWLGTEAAYIERAPLRLDRWPAIMKASVQCVRINFDLRLDIRDDSGQPRTQAERTMLAQKLRKGRWELRSAVDAELTRLRRA